MKKITTPLTYKTIRSLKAGELVSITGIIYTARDAAHKKLDEIIFKGMPLPFELKGSVIYYVGPAPAKPGRPIGSAGPTTSSRMDPLTPVLLENGLKGMIGKGRRSKEVIDSIKKNKAVYFAATGGAGALLAKKIKECDLIAFFELGTEAIYKLKVKDFPVIVINDMYGRDLYEKRQEVCPTKL
ncbi:MAG: Fe-S-containing hydro-lyase [Elusimicrobia bacterium]|nr:Fe-S-containing hydro-lyase [Elusimicrobiota bacterium]MBU2615275.1 Fe-S-containing hydro-lyase [Elusimicrobiota bacterium]